MATIYKRTKRKNEPYVIQYVDHLGKRRTKKGFTDKGLTEELAAKLESEARLRTTGMIDPLQDRIAKHQESIISKHLEDFRESLADNTPAHVKVTLTRTYRMVEGCDFQSLADIDPEKVQLFLRKFCKKNDFGHRTYNHYLQAFDSFCNWCVLTKRLLANPLVGLERLNTAVDIRHARRALTPNEIALLIKSARESNQTVRSYSGEQRARLYLMSYMTGLRQKELGSLTPQSFDLHGNPPTVTVQAACSKHRRKDVLPLHPDLLEVLPEWLKGLKPTEFLFPEIGKKKA